MQRIAAGLALAILAGCGEKDEPETTGPVVTAETSTTGTTGSTTTDTTTTTSPKDQSPTSAPRAAQAFLSSPDAALVCDAVLSPEFLRKAYGDRAGCIAGRRPATLACPNSKLEVGPESNAGTRVDAQPQGGVYDGEKLTILVIRAGSAYLVDDVKSNAPVGP